MIHFETNSIINDKKSRYRQCIYISQKNYRFVGIYQKKYAEQSFSIFLFVNNFSLCQERI